MNRVFEGIRDHLGEDERYREALGTVESQHQEVAQAQRDLERAQADLQRSESARTDRSIEAVGQRDESLGASIRTLESTIDLDPAKTQISTLREEVDALRTVGGRLTKGWSAASKRRRGLVLGLALLALVALVALVSVGTLPKSAEAAAAVLALVVPLLTALNALLRPARLALDAGARILRADDVERRRYDEARRRRDEAAEALARAKQMGPAELYGYVADRSAAAEYKQHLGMAPIIRDDLRRLARMAPQKGGSPGIDRVVIFIDDLDRCPASEVVRVLEAVNLLFGFPLFVVVVAVDSRWLIRSLETEFSEAFKKAGESAPTPRNYLEKIIQIPFWLSPMQDGGFGRLITTLVGEVEERQRSGAQSDVSEWGLQATETPAAEPSPFHEPRAGPNPPPSPSPTPHADANGQSAPNAPNAPDAPDASDASDKATADLNPESLTITADERDYMRGFSRLVTTPRAAKRFLNTYQLLRTGVRDVETFLDEEQFKPVLVILALITGTSLVDDVMIAELRAMTEPDFPHFLEARSGDRWQELSSACTGLPIGFLTLDVMEEWLPVVARYSFYPPGH